MIKKIIMVVNKTLSKLRYHEFFFLAGQVPQARPCRNPVGPRSRPYLNDVITHSNFLTSDLQRDYSSGSIDTKGDLFFHMNAVL